MEHSRAARAGREEFPEVLRCGPGQAAVRVLAQIAASAAVWEAGGALTPRWVQRGSRDRELACPRLEKCLLWVTSRAERQIRDEARGSSVSASGLATPVPCVAPGGCFGLLAVSENSTCKDQSVLGRKESIGTAWLDEDRAPQPLQGAA